MVGLERDILILMSRVRCVTETQVGKVFGNRKIYKKPFKKTLRKMCNEYTLRKYPCNINYPGYKDNSYVYYLNGSKMYKGKELDKVIIGSEIMIKLKNNGYEVKRMYRNVIIDGTKIDLFLEYSDKYNDIKQILVDIDIEGRFNVNKYKNIEEKILKSTIPFFETPKLLVVTIKNTESLNNKKYDIDINFLDMHLSKLFRYI